MFFLIIIVTIIYLYWKAGLNYAKGMMEYAVLNNVGEGRETTWDSVRNEFNELKQAIRDMDIFDIILEIGDVIHSFIKHICITYLPEKVYCSYWLWFCVYPFILPCTYKLGMRHKMYGCIRNHNNSNNCNHRCFYQKN